MEFMPYGKQEITGKDVKAVVDILNSPMLTQGSAVPEFESKIKTIVNAKYCSVANSATSALHLACLALGVQKNDTVWTSAISFVASANCARYCGAEVELLDIELDTRNICIDQLKVRLEDAKNNNQLPKVIIVVHFAGLPCDMLVLKELSNIYGFKIIEDASHAIGAKYLESSIGDCEYSDITVFSFHPVKIITTGEGGAALTNDARLASLIEMYRSHGITKDISNFVNKENNECWQYEQQMLGYNYRMTDIQAALGMSQIERLDQYILKRNAIARDYNELFKSEAHIKTPQIYDDRVSSWHLYTVLIDFSEIGMTRDNFMSALRDMSIGTQVHYIPIYKQPYYSNKDTGFPVAEEYYSKALSLPIYPLMNSSDVQYIVKSIKKIIKN